MYSKAILIAGPTASGKSALALGLAERVGGMIINADSMQVYRELRILTARPSPDDEARAPHALYGHVAGKEGYSAGRYMADAATAIAEARRRGLVPIIAGGTGLYFKALLEGLSPVPSISEDIRRHWRGEALRLGPEALHGVLAARDPEMAERLRPTDPQRVTRALEVLEATGRSLAAWHEMPGEPVLVERETIRLVVEIEREELNRRCDVRLAAMMDEGAVEEVARLAALGLDPELPVMRALGVRPFLQLLAGRIGRAEALALAQGETRRYAKRQQTWLRSNMTAWMTISAQQKHSIDEDILPFIRNLP